MTVMAVSVCGEHQVTSEELAAAADTFLSSIFLLVCLQSGLPAAIALRALLSGWTVASMLSHP